LEQLIFQDSGKTIHSAEIFLPHIKELDFSQRWGKKKFKMADLKNSKWPPQKKLIFQLRQSSIFFHEIPMDWSLG
jgi:hypothetical protein